METLATGFGKSPFSIKPGDRLRSANLKQVQRAKVKGVSRPNSNGVIFITTEDEDREREHAFYPGQVVVFPRRSAGNTVIHWYNPKLEDLHVGDIVGPPNGWPDGEPDLENGRLITDILPSRRHGGFIISYRPVNGKRGGKMFSDMTPLLYGGAWTDFPEDLPEKSKYKPEPKTASGVYIHLESGEEARFRIAGTRGRSPEGTVYNSPGSTIGSWEPWQLLSGKAHPSDPRK
jgi:hypothetical protein